MVVERFDVYLVVAVGVKQRQVGVPVVRPVFVVDLDKRWELWYPLCRYAEEVPI